MELNLRWWDAPPWRPAVSTVESVQRELVARFGEVIERMLRSGFLTIWPDTAAYNAQASESRRLTGEVQGCYSNGQAHLFAADIPKGDAPAVFAHEVAVHGGLQLMLGPLKTKQLAQRVRELAEEGDPLAMAALERIPADTPPSQWECEAVAYLVELAVAGQQQPAGITEAVEFWLRELLAALVAWVVASGLADMLAQQGVTMDLSPADILALGMVALRWRASHLH